MSMQIKFGLIVLAVAAVFIGGGAANLTMMVGEADKIGMSRELFRKILIGIGVLLLGVAVLIMTGVIHIPEQPQGRR